MKFSIITPVHNGEKFIVETIESVLSQEGDFEIEYIIMDGGSTDETIEIIKKYDTLLKEKKYPVRCKKIKLSWFSEKDGGVGDALNKGFQKATGDIYAWINGDDFYLPLAFFTIARIFGKYKDTQWLKGTTDFLKKEGSGIVKGTCYIYNQKWIEMGIYGRNAYFIQQDSVFWKAGLWKQTRGIKNTLHSAVDYYLWLQFAKRTPLYTVNKEVSCFRTRAGQLSENMEKYQVEQASLSQERGFLNFKVKLFFWIKQHFPQDFFVPFFNFLYRTLFSNRQTTYIELNEKQEPFIKRTNSYIIP